MSRHNAAVLTAATLRRPEPSPAPLTRHSTLSPPTVTQSQGSAVAPPGFLNTDCRFGFANCNPSWLHVGCASPRAGTATANFPRRANLNGVFSS